jgi:hypothetical protein
MAYPASDASDAYNDGNNCNPATIATTATTETLAWGRGKPHPYHAIVAFGY